MWSKNSFNVGAHGTSIVPGRRKCRLEPQSCYIDGERCARVGDVAKAAVNGTAIMGGALDAFAGAGSEVLAFSSSSYRQNFVF